MDVVASVRTGLKCALSICGLVRERKPWELWFN